MANSAPCRPRDCLRLGRDRVGGDYGAARFRRTARSWAEAGGATLAQSGGLLAHSQETAAKQARFYSVAEEETFDAALDALLTSKSAQALTALLAAKEE